MNAHRRRRRGRGRARRDASSTLARRRGTASRRSAGTSGSRRSARAASASSASKARAVRRRVHDAVPRRHGGRHRRRRRAHRVAKGVVELVLSELPEPLETRRRSGTSSAPSRSTSALGEVALRGRAPRARAATIATRTSSCDHESASLRPLRPRVRRGAGRVRADRVRGPRLRHQHRRRARRGLHRLGVRLVRRVRRRPARPARSTKRRCSRATPDRSTATATTTTCGYCGVGCRLEAHARGDDVVVDHPALDGPANHGHTCVKGRFAHQFARSRDRLTHAADPRTDGGFARGDVGRGARLVADTSARDQGASTAPTRSRGSRSLALHERGELRRSRSSCAPRSARTTSTTARASATRRRRSALHQLARPVGRHRTRSTTSSAPRCMLLTGANPTEAHPVVGARMKQAALRRREARSSPTRAGSSSPTTADVFTAAAAGHERRRSSTALAHVIVRDGLVDRALRRRAHRGLRALRRAHRRVPPDEVERSPASPAKLVVERPRTSTRVAGARRSSTASASPSSRRAPPACAAREPRDPHRATSASRAAA